jgi:hypothetical protein
VDDPTIPGDICAKSQEVQDLFQCLSDHYMDSPSEIHLTVGDLNSYTGVEQESHILPEEVRNIPR